MTIAGPASFSLPAQAGLLPWIAGGGLVTSFVRADRPNVLAWSYAAKAAVAAYVAALIVAMLRSSDDFPYTAGRVFVPAALAVVVVGAVAANSSRLWRWWWYLAAAAAFVALLTVAVEMQTGAGSSEGIAAGSGSTLSVPAVAHGWTLVRGSEAEARRQVQIARAERNGDVAVAYGEYRQGAGLVGFLGANTIPGSSLRAELQDSPRSAVWNAAAGQQVSSPRFVASGRSGVAMACSGSNQAQQAGVIECVWGDATALGFTTWVVPGLTLDRAAQLTRQFLGAVSRLNT